MHEARKDTGGDKKVSLTFFETMTSPGRTAAIQAIIDDYKTANPGTEINLISPPYEQADNKLTLMLTSNQDLDVIEVRDHTVFQTSIFCCKSYEDFRDAPADESRSYLCTRGNKCLWR